MRKVIATKNNEPTTYDSIALCEKSTGVLSVTICWAIKNDRELNGYTFAYESWKKNSYNLNGEYSRKHTKDLLTRIAEKRKEIELRG